MAEKNGCVFSDMFGGVIYGLGYGLGYGGYGGYGFYVGLSPLPGFLWQMKVFFFRNPKNLKMSCHPGGDDCILGGGTTQFLWYLPVYGQS